MTIATVASASLGFARIAADVAALQAAAEVDPEIRSTIHLASKASVADALESQMASTPATMRAALVASALAAFDTRFASAATAPRFTGNVIDLNVERAKRTMMREATNA